MNPSEQFISQNITTGEDVHLQDVTAKVPSKKVCLGKLLQ